MAPSFFSTIRFRILLLIVVSTLPALGLIYYIAQEQRDLQIRNLREASLHETRIRANTVGRIIENAKTLLITIANVIETHKNDRTFAVSHMQNLLKKFPYYNNILTTDELGNLDLTAIPSSRSVNYADRLWFKRVEKTKAFSIGEYVFGRVTKAHIITFAYPINNKQGKFQGAVVISVDLMWLHNQMIAMPLPSESFRAVIDQGGVILAANPDQEKWVGKALPEAVLVKTILSKKEGTEEIEGIDGVNRIFSFTPVVGTSGNMFVSYGVGKDLAMTNINRTLIRNISLLGIACVLAILGALFLGNVLIMRRVRILVAVSERLGNGDFKARPDLLHRRDELGQVASAIDKMAEKLENYDLEKRVAEDEIRKLNAELEQRVAARTAELEDRTREMEAFTYSVSHDLKSPLRGIDGYSRLLLDGYHDRLDEEGRTFLKNIRLGADQMDRLIQDLLAYSRMERRSLESKKVNPGALVQTLIGDREDEIKAREITINVDIPLVELTADPDGLSQAIRNLLDNAIKYTQGVPAPKIEIGGQTTEKSFTLWVRDNGIGFDMSYHDRIFEIFQRLQKADDYSGTGIGLAIVRKSMQRMGGRAWAESVPGQGATFYLELPA